MVQKFMKLLQGEVSAIHHAAYVLAAATFGSQLLALFRDRIFASLYGVGPDLDRYYAAFRIPDMLYVVVSAIISVAVLLPLIIEREKSGKSVRELISTVVVAYTACMIVGGIIAFIAMPFVVPWLFPHIGTGTASIELVYMSRLLLLSPILLGFSNILSALVQAHRRFFLTALSPILYNLGIIVGAVFLGQHFGILGAVYGVLGGALLHVAIQLPYALHVLRNDTGSRVLMRGLRMRELKSIVLTSLPRTLSLSVAELVEFLLVIKAGVLVSGSIAVFTFAWNLQSVPLALIGASFSVALFPTLSRLHAELDTQGFKEKLLFTLRQVLFFGAAATALAIVLRAHIVRVTLGAGLFSWSDTRLTAAALALFVISLLGQSFALVLTRAWYARGNTFTPVFANSIGGLISIASVFALLRLWNATALGSMVSELLRVSDLADTRVLALPLAFSFGSAICSIILVLLISTKIRGLFSEILKSFLVHVCGGLIVGVAAYVALNLFDQYFVTDRLLGILLHGAVAAFSGAAAGALFYVLIKNQEMLHVWDGIRRRSGVKVVVEE